MDKFYARPVLPVADIKRSLDFYVGKLGFKEQWRYEYEGLALIVQVERGECELILSAEWPQNARAGAGVMFIELLPNVLDAVRREYEARGVAVEDGRWGYPLMVVRDPDGNQLWFPYDVAPDGVGEIKRSA